VWLATEEGQTLLLPCGAPGRGVLRVGDETIVTMRAVDRVLTKQPTVPEALTGAKRLAIGFAPQCEDR
jgi:hypothetical protein